jgi:hypothetical protein
MGMSKKPRHANVKKNIPRHQSATSQEPTGPRYKPETTTKGGICYPLSNSIVAANGYQKDIKLPTKGSTNGSNQHIAETNAIVQPLRQFYAVLRRLDKCCSECRQILVQAINENNNGELTILREQLTPSSAGQASYIDKVRISDV